MEVHTSGLRAKSGGGLGTLQLGRLGIGSAELLGCGLEWSWAGSCRTHAAARSTPAGAARLHPGEEEDRRQQGGLSGDGGERGGRERMQGREPRADLGVASPDPVGGERVGAPAMNSGGWWRCKGQRE